MLPVLSTTAIEERTIFVVVKEYVLSPNDRVHRIERAFSTWTAATEWITNQIDAGHYDIQVAMLEESARA
jgi:hypothetical protein